MRLNKLTLPGKIRRRDRLHTGQVRMPASNQRWCPDGFNIRCWNGDRVTVSYTHEPGFRPITTPAYSPESNGMAEALVNTIKCGYVNGVDLSDADTVLSQLPG